MKLPLLGRAVVAALCLIFGSVLSIRSALVAEAQAGESRLATSLGIQASERKVETALAGPATDSLAVSPGDRQAALDSIGARPLSGAPFLLLGLGVAQSDQAAASHLVDAALVRDPRLANALLWKLREQLRALDFPAATRYNIRLLGLLPTELKASDMLAGLAQLPGTRAVILHALSSNPDWRTNALNSMTANGVDKNFIYQAMAVGVPATVNRQNERANFLHHLIDANKFEEAYTTWISWLPEKSLSAIDYVYDGNFDGAVGTAPFNWTFKNEPAGSADPDGQGLSISVDGTSEVVLAQQMVLLPAGRYRMSSMVNAEEVSGLAAVPSLVWQVTCLPRGTILTQVPIPLDKGAVTIGSQPFDIDADCRAQSLELRSKSAAFPARVSATMRYIKIQREP